jgi:integrase
MKTNRPDNSQKYWRASVRLGSHTVYAWERLDRRGAIFLKFSHPDAVGRDRRVKVKLPGERTVRDLRQRISQKLVKRVLDEVAKFAAPLLQGRAPATERAAASALTLAEGFSLALDLENGKYPTRSLRWQEVNRGRQKIERLIGRNKLWIEIRLADVRAVWRAIANEFVRSTQERLAGARQTEVAIDALYSVAAWLRNEGHIPPDAALPAPKWRAKLKEEWQAITKTEVVPFRPRHSEPEMQRLFASMHSPEVDPRFALAFDLGGEQRIGQVLRCMRSHMDLDPSAAPSMIRGLVRVPSAGHKRTSTIALAEAQRRVVDAALSGYLANYEAAWQRGVIEDYPLFPAGRLVAGRAKVVSSPKCLTRDAALGMFYRLEAAAGVPHVEGRGWYGVRRIAADVAEHHEKDERVLNSLTGHRDSTTRQNIYQQRERPEVLAMAAQTRMAARGLLAGTSVITAQVVPPSVPQSKTASGSRPKRFTQVRETQQLLQERATGLEPATSSLGSWHSTN